MKNWTLITIAGAIIIIGIFVFVASFNEPRAYNPTIASSSTLNFGSINPQEVGDLTATVTGAADGDPVLLGVPNAVGSSMVMVLAWVSAANTVTVRVVNIGLTPIDPPSASFRIIVTKF